MDNYLKSIEEAIQRTPEEKKKAKAIQKDFEECFGDRIYSKKFDYEVNVEDLKKVFDIANKWFFRSKLDLDSLDISTSPSSSEDFYGLPREKGSFVLRLDENGKHKLIIRKRSNKDNFFHIVNVFLHELIHFYDCEHGEMRKHLSELLVHAANGRQYVNDYDAHGKYFKDWCSKLNNFGFAVKEKYTMKDKTSMRKVIETTNKKIDEDSLNDKISKLSDEEAYKTVKAIYNSLKNCDKDMSFKDAKHWYISIS